MSSDILNAPVDLDVDLENVKVSYESTVDSAYANYSAIPLTILPSHVAATNVLASSYSSTSVQFMMNTDGMNLINRDPILSFKDIQFTIKRNAMSEPLFRTNPSKIPRYQVRRFLSDEVGLRWRELGFINCMSNIKVTLNGQTFTFDNIARTMKNEFWFVDRDNLPEVPCTKKDFATSVEVYTMSEHDNSTQAGDKMYSLYDNARGPRVTHVNYEPYLNRGKFEKGEDCGFDNVRIVDIKNDEFTLSVDFTCPLPQRLFSNFVESQSFSGIKNINVQINFDPDMNKAIMKRAGTLSSVTPIGLDFGVDPNVDSFGQNYIFTWFNCRATNFTFGSPPEISFSIVEPSKIEQTKRTQLIEASGVEPPSIMTYSDVFCNENTSLRASPNMQTHSDNFNIDAIPESLTFYSKFNPAVQSTIDADGIPIMPNTLHSHAIIPDYYNCIDRLNIRIGNREYVFNHKELYRLSVRAGMKMGYSEFSLGAPVRIRMEDLGYGVNSGNHYISEQINNFNISYTIHFYTRYSANYNLQEILRSSSGGFIGYKNGVPTLCIRSTWSNLDEEAPYFTLSQKADNAKVNISKHTVGGAVPLVTGCDVSRTVYVKSIPEKNDVSQFTSLAGVVDESLDLETRIAMNFMPRPMVLMGGAWYHTVGKFMKNVAKKIVTPENFASVARFLQENLLVSGMRGGRAFGASNVVGRKSSPAYNVIGGNRSRVLGGKALPKGFK